MGDEAYKVVSFNRAMDAERTIRMFLHGATSKRSAMYTGLGQNVAHLGCLAAMLDWNMLLLATLSTDRNWRDFGEIAGWGRTGMSKFVKTEQPWDQNIKRLNGWVVKFESWLESPLERIARAAAE